MDIIKMHYVHIYTLYKNINTQKPQKISLSGVQAIVSRVTYKHQFKLTKCYNAQLASPPASPFASNTAAFSASAVEYFANIAS